MLQSWKLDNFYNVGRVKFLNVLYILKLSSRYFQDYSLEIPKTLLKNFLSQSVMFLPIFEVHFGRDIQTNPSPLSELRVLV